MPQKTDATTPCKCGGTMKISMIEPLPMEPDKMQHSYTCAQCGEVERYKFLKNVSSGAAR